MTNAEENQQAAGGAATVVSASAVINAPARTVFELIADPACHADWDGNDNVSAAPIGQRIHQVGDVFTASLTTGAIRENRVVEFQEDRRIAWLPGEQGKEAFGHLWRWELEPLGADPSDSRTRVTHTYDWSGLPADADPRRISRARATTDSSLLASILRLKELAEHG